jgi:hypothetical protein
VSRVLDAAHLPPPLRDAERILIHGRGDIAATVPVMTPDLADAACRHLLAAGAKLRQLPVQRIIHAIDAAARQLRDNAGTARADVLAGLVAFTGCSAAMAELVLDRMSQDWLAPALHQLLDAELGGAAAIETFTGGPGGRRVHAVAPHLGFHVFAGNVPGVSVTSIVRALLVRSAVLGKSAADEPVLAPAFARLLEAADPDVGAAAAVTWWPGGSAEIEDAIVRHARLVVHYGGADAIASLRARAGDDVAFIEHGPKVSFAVVRPAALGAAKIDGAAADLARAVALFDQQGCVSPQAAWVVGTADDARDFARRTAEQLTGLARELPRGHLQPGEAAAIRDLRTSAEFRAIRGEDVGLWADQDLACTVILEPGPSFGGSCLNRTLIVHAVADAAELVRRLAPFGRFMQTVGVAGFDDGDLLDLARRLADAGATRITTLHAMPWPPVTWHHDGRGPLRELVRWVDLET